MAPAAPAPAAALLASSSSSVFSSLCRGSMQPALDFRNPLLSACSSKANGPDIRFVRGSAIPPLPSSSARMVRARAETEDNGAEQPANDPEVASAASAPSPRPQQKQSLLEALDFSAVRSEEDMRLLEDARSATSVGEKMSREQYAALRRKIGGTYRDFFKDSIEVDGEFVDEGWVDKSCRFCKKDTASEPRTVDKFGRYAHVTCLEKSKSGNFFTRLFGM